MSYRIKDWNKFQHFKDRRPTWIKLYRTILDDLQWHQLSPEAAKTLVMLWLIASESEGLLPDLKTLAWRLRMPETKILNVISSLEHWVYQDDINPISNGYQVDDLEKRREEREKKARAFISFWEAYPKKKSKGAAEKAWNRINPTSEQTDGILAAIERAKTSEDWTKDGGKYIPYPATWLNAKGWEDDFTPMVERRKEPMGI